MSVYALFDHLPDLTPRERRESTVLNFETSDANEFGYDNTVVIAGNNKNALSHSLYKFNATEGATYDIVSLSFFDPFLLRVFDQDGNVIAVNDESKEFPVRVGSTLHEIDAIIDWEAPYTGEFYVQASWNQGQYYTSYGLTINEDIDTATGAVSRADLDKIFDWGQMKYPELLSNDENSVYYAGYYARLYDNDNAVGEQNGDIYFFNSQNNEIVLVGNAHDLLNQVINDGF